MLPLTRLTLLATAAAALVGARPVSLKPNVVTITASDFKFEGPDSIAAGLTTIRLVNNGPGIHHLVLVRMDEGKTMDDLAAAMKQQGPPPAWMHDVPGPNAPRPGGESNVTVVLPAGNYAMLCFVDVPDHVPHAMKGMVRALTVTPAYGAARGVLPAATTTMTLRDYAFGLSKPLHSGRQVIRVRNVAKQPHEVELVRLAPGKTTTDMLAWLDKMDGPPPGEPLGGVVGVEHGAQANFTADLTPGRYALICFLPDGGDGKPHFMHGMTRELAVK
jgi:hypothetical protein